MIKERKITIIFSVIFIMAVFFIVKNVSAATSTVRGKVWINDQSQYMYMSCEDDVIGDRLSDDVTVTHNLCGGNAANGYVCDTPPNNAFHFYSVPCSNLVHHVYLNGSGNFSGSAWNYAKGMIDFYATSSPPDSYAFNVNCPSTCNLSNNCSACYNETTQKVYGWARVAANGAWIRLDSTTTATRTPVALQNWNTATSTLPGHNIHPGDLIGYATTTSETLSFNCESEWNGVSAGNCGVRDYRAYISELQVGHLSAPNWSYAEACSGGAQKVIFKWYAKSGWNAAGTYTQTAYQIIANTVNSTSTPAFNSGKVSGTAVQYTCPGPLCAWTPSYSGTYYWWIRLWDANDQPTPWYQYGVVDDHNGSQDELTGGDPVADSRTFKIYAHEFPNPFFTWDPTDVIVGTSTRFVSNYAPSSPVTPLPMSCYGTCAYLWTTNNMGVGGDYISNPTDATTTIIFSHATSAVVTLSVTDSFNYVCSKETAITVNYGLPIWREVRAW